jgi:hypothetical protein
MAVSIAAILGDLREIKRRSPEDVAVLMTPLLRALEAAQQGRDPQLDHAQALAITNSLAQTAAQAGDIHAAVAIATLSAELEQIPPKTFCSGAVAGSSPAAPQAGSASCGAAAETGRSSPERHRLRPFANPYQQILGILGVCALSYAGYLEIQARFQPASVASWLLTGSSSLFALAVALAWRRFVLRRRRGPTLTGAALAFAMLASGWAVHTGLTLRPQIVARALDLQTAGTPGDAGAETTVTAGGPGAAASATGTGPQRGAPGQGATQEPAPIAFWWLGETPSSPATRIPRQAEKADGAGDAPTASAGPKMAPVAARGTVPITGTAAAARVRPVTGSAAAPGRGADAATQGKAGQAAPPHPQNPQNPVTRYRGLLEQEVVITDAKRVRHEGKLIGVSKHGVTLLIEVQLFGEPILAQRFYLFDNIENLHAKQ